MSTRMERTTLLPAAVPAVSAAALVGAALAASAALPVGVGVDVAQAAPAEGAGAAAQASAQDAAQAVVLAPQFAQVRLASVEGTFSFTQGEVASVEQIARALGGANKVLCGASTDVASSAEEVVPDAQSWEITVAGDGVQQGFSATLGELAATGSQSTVIGCSCLGNPADGRASVNAAGTGVTVYSILEAAGGVVEGANTITFVSSDGYEVALPLSYVLQRSSMIVYQVNGEPLSGSVGGTNQLWLGSTAARYFASDVVEIRVTCEEEAPAAPGSAAAANVPNVSVTSSAA